VSTSFDKWKLVLISTYKMDRIVKTEIKKEDITGIPSATLHGIEGTQQDHDETDLEEEDWTEADLELSSFQDADTDDSDVTLTQAETAHSMPLSDASMRKYPFKLKQNECG